ncbi:hypothetical protein EST38_g12503 [Candolleomyces aberdarensis]|uniref:Uncharacterized protein n=1 Tax=Candolleomyces aberdarensis TaxID=2316362 RepID=A0A4Q2D4H3_9AGAR|nr:hypothetical protein EST38_g12503 [Candolleomyces aberdarensis]
MLTVPRGIQALGRLFVADQLTFKPKLRNIVLDNSDPTDCLLEGYTLNWWAAFPPEDGFTLDLASIINAWRAQARDAHPTVDVPGANHANLQFLSRKELEIGCLLAMDAIWDLDLSEKRLMAQLVHIGTMIGLTRTLKQQLQAIEARVIADKLNSARIALQESSATATRSVSVKGKEKEIF